MGNSLSLENYVTLKRFISETYLYPSEPKVIVAHFVKIKETFEQQK